MHKTLMMVALLATTVLAGCLSGDGNEPNNPITECTPGTMDKDGVVLALPTDDIIPVDRDVWDFSATNYRTCSLEKVGHTALRFDADGTPNPHRYIGEIDMKADLNLGAVAVLGNGEAAAVYLLDISDRANPTVLSRIDQQNVYITDVKLSTDGAFLFTASQTIPTSPEPDTDLEVNTPVGFSAYNIRDPSNPVWVNTFVQPQGIGCHMLAYQMIQGVDVVVCIGQTVRIFGLDRIPTGGLITRGFVDYLPEGAMGIPTLPYNNLVGNPGGLLPEYPHDASFATDPTTGQVLLAVAHWSTGVRLVDLSDAPMATELGSWQGEGATHYNGDIHSAQVVYADGKRYIIASPEIRGGEFVPSIWILDATDPADMHLVAEWYHPCECKTPGLLMTTHQWQVAPQGLDVSSMDVRIYLTMNHAGIWVLNLGSILAGDNAGAVEGFHMSRAALSEDSYPFAATYSTWDVNVIDGYIYGSDRATGLWVFDFDGDENVPATTGYA